MPTYIPPLVISIHGIRTDAHWQKTIGDFLNEHDICHRSFDYNRFSALKFLRASKREEIIDIFYDFYGQICRQYKNVDPDDGTKRPSVVAHSFGTYVVGYCLLKHEDVRFDKVIFCGAILPVDFDWFTPFRRDQVNYLKNEFGVRDVWAGLVHRVVRDAGSSGRDGFHFFRRSHFSKRFAYHRHSDYFHETHMRNHWLPFLRMRPSRFRVIHGAEIDDASLFKQYLNEAHAIDNESFVELPHYAEAVVPRGLTETWIRVNPDIYTFLIDRSGRLCGYINAMPITDDLFERLKAGAVADNEVVSDDIVPFAEDQTVKLYVMSIAIAADVRRVSDGLFQEPFEKLIYDFVGQLIDYAIYRKIRIGEIIAVGWTDTGRKLCETLRMGQLSHDRFGYPVYYLNMQARPFLEGKHKYYPIRVLAEHYRSHPGTSSDDADTVDG